MLAATGVRVCHPAGRGTLRRPAGEFPAVDDVDLELAAGECLALVGESGCGKTTLLHEIMERSPRSDGEIRLHGETPAPDRGPRDPTRSRRHAAQLVAQDATGALDPRFTTRQAIDEPLRAAGVPAPERGRRIRTLLATVGLAEDHLDRFPSQLSGGQRRRLAIARGLALDPLLLLLDEPVSGLDATIRAGILDLLADLRDRGTALLLVSHDLGAVRRIADRIAVMYLGRIVEIGDADDIVERPVHPYTQALLAAVPVPDPAIERTRARVVLPGDPPGPLGRPAGCGFAPRCPARARLDARSARRCLDERPPLVADATSTDHAHACLFPSASAARPTGPDLPARPTGPDERTTP